MCKYMVCGVKPHVIHSKVWLISSFRVCLQSHLPYRATGVLCKADSSDLSGMLCLCPALLTVFGPDQWAPDV